MLPFLAVAWAGTLAVAPFHDASGDPTLAPLGTGLADMVLTDLCGGTGLVCVERARVANLLGELALADTGWLDPATAQRMGRGLGADQVVLGTLASVDGTVRLDARLVEVETGKVRATVSVDGPRAAVFDLERRLAKDLGKRLGVTVGDAEAVSTEAITLYGQALTALDADKPGLARTLLDAAVKSDPKMRWAGDQLAALDVSLGRARETRADGLPAEVLALAERAITGDASACTGFQAKFWTLVQPVTMGGRLLTLDAAYALAGWQTAGLAAQPADPSEMARGVGRQLHDVYGVARVVLDAGASDAICPGANPNEVALTGAILAIGAARESAGGPVEIPMVAPDGTVVMTPSELDDRLLELADAYVTRFPTGGYVPTLSVWVGPAATRVAAR